MENKDLTTNSAETASEFVTVGDIKLPVELWRGVNTYKNDQRVKGRKLRMPEVSVELIARGLKAEGIV